MNDEKEELYWNKIKTYIFVSFCGAAVAIYGTVTDDKFYFYLGLSTMAIALFVRIRIYIHYRNDLK